MNSATQPTYEPFNTLNLMKGFFFFFFQSCFCFFCKILFLSRLLFVVFAYGCERDIWEFCHDIPCYTCITFLWLKVSQLEGRLQHAACLSAAVAAAGGRSGVNVRR